MFEINSITVESYKKTEPSYPENNGKGKLLFKLPKWLIDAWNAEGADHKKIIDDLKKGQQ